MSFFRCSLIMAALAVAFAAFPRMASAQDRPAISVTAGRTEYDLAGTGTRNFAAVRAQLPVGSFLVVEPGLGYMNYRVQLVRQRAHLWFPEVQLQAELPLRVVRPYLGAGAGISIGSFQGERETELTLSGAAGVRVRLGAGWGVGGELRVRAIDPWVGTTADFGLSLSRRL